MWTPQVLKNVELGRYGLGWGVYENEGEKRARHTGGQQGATTNLTLVIEDGVAVAVMTNREGFGGLGKLVEEILEIVRRP